MYTDGITETFNPAKEQFGDTRLAETIRAATGDAQAILQAFITAVDNHAGGCRRLDDQ